MRSHFSLYPRSLIILLVAAFAAFSLLTAGFVALVDEVQDNDTLVYDDKILLAINARSTDQLDVVMRVVTDFGSIGVAVFGILAVIICMRNKHTYRALFLVAAVGGAVILNLILKIVFSRPRPDLWQQIVTEVGYSFPSGHAMASGALAFSIIIVLWRTKYRYIGTFIALVYLLAIGFSRMYLGVHYPTDILAGWLVSAAWVTLVAAIVWRRRMLYKAAAALHNTTK